MPSYFLFVCFFCFSSKVFLFIFRKVFWTNRGPYSKIESSNLDGSNHTVLAVVHVGWPSGLTVDIANKRIYWADTKTKTISTVDIYGNDRHQAAKFLQGPFNFNSFFIYSPRLYLNILSLLSCYSLGWNWNVWTCTKSCALWF